MNGASFQGAGLHGVSLDDTALRAVTDDGRTLAGADLVGAKLQGVLSDGRTVDLTIAAFAEEAHLAYYSLEADGKPLCGPGGRGLFVPGVWDSTGARHDTLGTGATAVGVSYSCTDGAIAKCVLWGYHPSIVGADLHQSCTRMVRADYCGSGVSYTKNGTLIDVYDTQGIEQPTAGDSSFVFEAAWTTSGAACVNRTRYEAVSPSGSVVMPSCWSSLPTCTSWSEAQTRGATLGDSSRFQTATLCE
jgi:uncharacterized protein YjbI with pentapeptide repeats